jgi:hypothetical protein
MKTTEIFKKVISDKLEEISKSDPLFEVSLKKGNKSIDECINYILNTVQKSGCNGFTDDEIFDMAVHYYDEDNIEVKSPGKINVVVNHHVELTDEEKAEAKKQAQQEIMKQERERMLKKVLPKKPETGHLEQTLLF